MSRSGARCRRARRTGPRRADALLAAVRAAAPTARAGAAAETARMRPQTRRAGRAAHGDDHRRPHAVVRGNARTRPTAARRRSRGRRRRWPSRRHRPRQQVADRRRRGDGRGPRGQRGVAAHEAARGRREADAAVATATPPPTPVAVLAADAMIRGARRLHRADRGADPRSRGPRAHRGRRAGRGRAGGAAPAARYDEGRDRAPVGSCARRPARAAVRQARQGSAGPPLLMAMLPPCVKQLASRRGVDHVRRATLRSPSSTGR